MRKYRNNRETKTSKLYKEPPPEERSALEFYVKVLTGCENDPRSGLSTEQIEKFNAAERACKDWSQKLWEALRIVHHQLFMDSYVELTQIGRTMTAPANINKEPDEETNQKIRVVGQKLWDVDGIDMMRAVFCPVVNSIRVPELNSRLEVLWSGIGTWRR